VGWAVYFLAVLALGVLAALGLARLLKRQTFGLELREIAALLQEREAMLHGIREGVLGYDKNERIVLANDFARQLLDLLPEFVGRPLRHVLPPGRLADVATGEIEGSDLPVLHGVRVLAALGGLHRLLSDDVGHERLHELHHLLLVGGLHAVAVAGLGQRVSFEGGSGLRVLRELRHVVEPPYLETPYLHPTDVRGGPDSPELEQLPLWGFDGSSTMQAEGHSSDCVLKPVAVYPDGARTNGVLVMCEVMMPDGKTPHASNKRATILDDEGAWFVARIYD